MNCPNCGAPDNPDLLWRGEYICSLVGAAYDRKCHSCKRVIEHVPADPNYVPRPGSGRPYFGDEE